MKPTLTLILLLVAGPALAHPGHIADVAGHDHWIAGAAIGLAIGLGLWGALKGRKEKAATEVEESPEETEEEVAA